MKSYFPFGLSLTIGLAALALAGCGSGSGSAPLGTFAAPAPVPTVPGTPTPAPVPTTAPAPGSPLRADDFQFLKTNATRIASTAVLTPDGNGAISFVLQSVNGFPSAITFPLTVTATNPADGSTVSAGATRVTVSPATLTLPPGNTTATIAVKADSALPPLTRINVDLRAEGGGLQRFPQNGAYSNSGDYTFIVAGFRFKDFRFPSSSTRPFSGAVGSTVVATVFLETYGLTGTATLGVTGLPDGVTAVFDTPTLAITPSPTVDESGFPQFPSPDVTFTATRVIPAGKYPIRITATLNGVVTTSEVTDLVVGKDERG